MQKRPHPITYPRLVQCQARVSGFGCGRAGGEQWEVSACSCPVICFSCQDLLNKQPVHQVGISHVQGGFSLNLSRWECFLLQGSYLMFTLPKDHNRHLCANIRRHNLCPKHLMVWACRRPGVSPTDVTEVTGACLSRCSHFPSNSVSLYIYFGTVVSGREGARDWKHQEWGHEAGERCWWRQKARTNSREEIEAESLLPGKHSPCLISDCHHSFSEAVTSTGAENKGCGLNKGSFLFSVLSYQRWLGFCFLLGDLRSKLFW